MKQKIINIVLVLIAVLVPLLIAPIILQDNSHIYKFWTLGTCGIILLIILICNYKKFKVDKKDILILAFLLLIVASTFLSSDIKTSIFGHTSRYEGLITFITYICIYLCAKKFFRYENYKELFNILFIVYMLIGILGIAQRYINFFVLFPIFNKGICATFGNSNFFGSFISIVLPITIAIFVFKGNKRAFILSLVMFFNLISCTVRSAWVAFIIYFIIFLIYLIKEKNIKYFKRLVFCIICFTSIFIFLFNEPKLIRKRIQLDNKNKRAKIMSIDRQINKTVKELNQTKETGNYSKVGSGRIEIWSMTLKLIKQVPIFGCGTDNLYNGLQKYCPEEFDTFFNRTNTYVDKAHNEYLNIAATTGIPSLIVYLIFLSLVLFPKLKIMFKDKTILILSLAIGSYLIQAFFNISTLGIAPLLYMILGLIDNEEMLKLFKMDL